MQSFCGGLREIYFSMKLRKVSKVGEHRIDIVTEMLFLAYKNVLAIYITER